MQRLFAFLYRYRIFGYFLFLEAVCFWLLFRYNNYYNAYFFNSSNRLAASIQSVSNTASDYVQLQEVNQDLLEENTQLRIQLANVLINSTIEDTTSQVFNMLPATVINNTFRRSANYITINKGQLDGVKPDMAVVSRSGAVGKVKSVSDHFATIISLLHQELMVSSQLQSTKTLCTTQWDALDPLLMVM
jgi:rod shape-determining protein MreC